MELSRQTHYVSIPELLFENFDLDSVTAMGHDVKEFILGCWIGENMERSPCNISTITLYQSAKYFNCYTIAGGRHRHTEMLRKGLSLILYFDKNVNVTPTETFKRELLLYGDVPEKQGGRLEIHEDGTLPNPRIRGIDILPGFQTEIRLTQTTRKNLGQPYSSCTKRPYLKGLADYRYSTNGCLDLCMAKHIPEACHCSSGYWHVHHLHKPFCRSLLHFNVSDCEDTDRCEKYGFMKTFNSAKCKCHEKCDYDKYSLTKWVHPWPDDDEISLVQFYIVHPLFGDYEKQPFPGSIAYHQMEKVFEEEHDTKAVSNWARQNLARVKIYFVDDLVEVMEETALVTFPDLMAGESPVFDVMYFIDVVLYLLLLCNI